MPDFLLEVLAEEIPAGVLPQARHDLLQGVAKALAQARIEGTFFVHSTPRRLALIARNLPERQADAVIEVTGPPVSVAFDAEGNPTKAAEGFARTNGIPVDMLERFTTPKGEYVKARRLVEGRDTAQILAEAVPPIVEKMTFPRMMRWGDGSPTWVRPVHSVLALFGGKVVPLKVLGVAAGKRTWGHRTLAPASGFDVESPENYLAWLRLAHVEPDYSVRRRTLVEKAETLAATVGGKPAQDTALVDSWAHLVEWPGLIRGSFDPGFLELPEEILVTTMRHHQKVLAIRDASGKLMPHFLAVCDQTGDPAGHVVRGNEWVLSARFADARFFWEDDARLRLEDRLARLGSLQFQEKLGDYLRKTGRIQELSERLCARLRKQALEPEVVQAARLLKTDLVTDMVREFTDLQGVVGGLYARREGEPESVWQAIYDQYKPGSFDEDVPRGDVGGIVAVADRLDTLTGLFGLGLVPTGSRDPYALRRAALGVVKILVDKGWRLDMPVACSDALLLHGALPRKREEVLPELNAFLLDRLRNLLERRGHRYDEIEAVLTTEVRDVADAADRVAAVSAIRRKEDFGPLSVAFKRINNILAQVEEGFGEPDTGRMTDEAERALASDFLQARDMLDHLVSNRKYGEALRVMASLGPSLDRFFVEVLVMADDEAVRRNRIALLRAIRDQFARVARFDQIQG